MATLAHLVVKLTADIGKFEQGMERAQATVSRVSAKMRRTGAVMTGAVTAPLTGVAVAAYKAGESLDRGMANVASLGVATERGQELKSGVQELAIATGKSTSDMAEGLYQVVSAFGDTADTMPILEINARAAAAGLATTEDAINLTSAVMKGYGDVSAEAAQKTADLALMTVQLGQTTFPELASSMGRVVPIAANMGVKQEELFGVMATLTGVTGSASEVSTQLRGALQALMAPTETTQALMAGLGYESGEAMVQQLGLGGALQAIVRASEATNTPLQKYIGSIEGQTLALALAGPQAETFEEKLAAMGDAAGATDKAFAAQTQVVNKAGFAVQQAREKMEVFFQKIYSGLMPAFAALLEALQPVVDWLMQMADRFAMMDPKMQLVIAGVAAFAAALGPLLLGLGVILPALGAIGAALGALLSPVGLVVAAIVGAAMLIYAAWTNNWGGIRDKAAAVLAWIEGAVGRVMGVLQGWWAQYGDSVMVIWDAIVSVVQSAMAGVEGVIRGVMDGLRAFWDAWGSDIMLLAQTAWDNVMVVIKTALTVIGEIINAMASAIKGDWRGFGEHLRKATDAMMTGLKTIFRNGLRAVVRVVSDIVERIRAKFTNIDWGEVGRAVVRGIANGITAGAGAIAEAARNAAAAALAAAKGFLGIHSPSAVMRLQVGMQIARGWAAGIRAGEGMVSGAASGLASATVEGAQLVGGGGCGGGNIVINYQPTVSLGDRYEFERVLLPMMRDLLRAEGVI